MALSSVRRALERRLRATAAKAVTAAIGALFLIGAVGFFLVATHVWLSDMLGPVLSAVLIGGVLMILGLGTLLFGSRSPRLSERHGSAETGTTELDRTGAPAGPARAALRNPVVQAAGLSMLIGLLLGRRGNRN